MASRNPLFGRITHLICAVVILAGPRLTSAGDLNPPAGPIAPTQRTPVNANMTPGDADSLFKISLPGSYYLTGNITGVAAKHGVEIAASGVTLDLNGFDLLGVAGSLDGVSATVPNLNNIAVVNGSVRNWGDKGIDLWTNVVTNCRVAGVTASGNAGYGIAAGSASTISQCSASSNTTYGIFAFVGSTISHCAAYLNNGRGIFTGNGGVVSYCTSYQNTDFGFLTSAGCTIIGCSSNDNGSDGYNINSNSTINSCTAFSNGGDGISCAAGCLVRDCSARQNTVDGIFCTSDCIIQGNTCISNGFDGDGAGIHANINDNRIEGNNCMGNDRGIEVSNTGNIILRNTCGSNGTNWAFVANNVFGPIIDRTAPGSLAVSGSSAPSSLGSTEPNANFSY